MWHAIRKFAADEAGPTAVEYALLVAAIAGVVIVAARLLGQRVNNTFERVTKDLPSG